MGTVGLFVFLGLAGLGAVLLGVILNKYAGVFGVFKSYLVCIPSCLTFAQLLNEEKPSVILMIAGLAGSYLLAIVLTRNLSPLVWINMILAGFGWTLRLILSFIGVAMPIVVKNAEEGVAREAEATAQRIEDQKRRDAIKAEAYRKYGVRGQVNSDCTYWRPDEDSDWVRVHRN